MRRSEISRTSQLVICALVVAQLVLPSMVRASDSDDATTEATFDEFEPEEIDMRPDDGPVSWGLRNVFAPFTSIFKGGPSYWYKDRMLEVETTPPGGMVDLFYVRSGFQKRFEQAETPVTVILPPRIEAGDRDILTIRAFREGHRQKSVSVPVKSRDELLIIDLEPLPNLLSAFSSRYFAGRASLTFLTTEALTHRIQESDAGFAVILVETGMAEGIGERVDSAHNPLVEAAFGQQLGEDLMISIELSQFALGDSIEPRTREMFDAARDLHSFTVDLVPTDGGAEAIARARAALPKLQRSNVSGCAVAFDESLREQLDLGELNRALSPHSSFAGPYLRAAMRRLGEVLPSGRVELTDGSSYTTAIPIELEMALTQAGSVKGYLALLREFAIEVEGSEFARATLRSLVAPEADNSRFGEMMDTAELREKSCLAMR